MQSPHTGFSKHIHVQVLDQAGLGYEGIEIDIEGLPELLHVMLHPVRHIYEYCH